LATGVWNHAAGHPLQSDIAGQFRPFLENKIVLGTGCAFLIRGVSKHEESLVSHLLNGEILVRETYVHGLTRLESGDPGVFESVHQYVHRSATTGRARDGADRRIQKSCSKDDQSRHREQLEQARARPASSLVAKKTTPL
jgi:hypothetical protein